jgi:hypothetical protein
MKKETISYIFAILWILISTTFVLLEAYIAGAITAVIANFWVLFYIYFRDEDR